MVRPFSSGPTLRAQSSMCLTIRAAGPAARSRNSRTGRRFGCLTGWGAWTDSDMQGGPVDELLDVAVEPPALDQLEVEVGRTLEDRLHSGLTGDHSEERHLDAVDQAG